MTFEKIFVSAGLVLRVVAILWVFFMLIKNILDERKLKESSEYLEYLRSMDDERILKDGIYYEIEKEGDEYILVKSKDQKTSP